MINIDLKNIIHKIYTDKGTCYIIFGKIFDDLNKNEKIDLIMNLHSLWKKIIGEHKIKFEHFKGFNIKIENNKLEFYKKPDCRKKKYFKVKCDVNDKYDIIHDEKKNETIENLELNYSNILKLDDKIKTCQDKIKTFDDMVENLKNTNAEIIINKNIRQHDFFKTNLKNILQKKEINNLSQDDLAIMMSEVTFMLDEIEKNNEQTKNILISYKNEDNLKNMINIDDAMYDSMMQMYRTNRNKLSSEDRLVAEIVYKIRFNKFDIDVSNVKKNNEELQKLLNLVNKKIIEKINNF
jgi:hypothetical protein